MLPLPLETFPITQLICIVDSSLNRCHLPSPSGTYLVSYRGISTIRDPLVQRGFILRIMRYVSFHAWGTLRADGNRRKSSLDRIIENLWTPDPFSAGIQPFVAGGGVFWQPVLVGGSNMMRIPSGFARPGPSELVGWLASRQPPVSPTRMERIGMYNPLRIDVTEDLREKLHKKHKNPGQVLEVLWDCRFLIKMDIDKIPDKIVQGILDVNQRVMILPNTRFYWPKIVFERREKQEMLLHSTLSVPEQGVAKLDLDMMAKWKVVRIDEATADWIRSEWIRSIAA